MPEYTILLLTTALRYHHLDFRDVEDFTGQSLRGTITDDNDILTINHNTFFTRQEFIEVVKSVAETVHNVANTSQYVEYSEVAEAYERADPDISIPMSEDDYDYTWLQYHTAVHTQYVVSQVNQDNNGNVMYRGSILLLDEFSVQELGGGTLSSTHDSEFDSWNGKKLHIGDTVRIRGQTGTYTIESIRFVPTVFVLNDGRAFSGNELVWIASVDPARSAFYDTLVPNSIIPRVVAVGTTYTLEQFRQLGPFRIERKLFYDDFSIPAKDVNCDIAFPGNRKYPVMTIPQNHVYCVTNILQWVLAKNSDGTMKNTDPYTNKPIQQIRVMNEQDIEKKELEEFTKEKEKKEKEREEKNTSGADRRDIRKLDYRIRELERMIRERKTEKIRRKTLNRLLELKF